MTTTAWLNTADMFAPGAELYRSERCFTMWAYTISHGQLLFRSRQGLDRLRRDHGTTIDMLFKPAIAMKLQDRYEGLAIRCATEDEAAQVLADLPQVSLFPDDRIIVVDGAGTTGYVVCKAMGWHEGVLDVRQHSFFDL